MWNPFKRHRAKKALEMLDSLTSIIATIKKWEKAGKEWTEAYLPGAFDEAKELIDVAKKRKGYL